MAGSVGGRAIRHAVGKGCPNRRDDVSLVQYLLNCVPEAEGGPPQELAVDGVCGPRTREAISRFETAQSCSAAGRVEPAIKGGRTIDFLNAYDPLPDVTLPFARSKKGPGKRASSRSAGEGSRPVSAAPRTRMAEPRAATAFVREVLLPGSVPGQPKIDARHARFPLAPRPSPIHRWGIFSTGPIPARRRVIEYTGEKINDREVWRRRLRQHLYTFWLSDHAALDGGIGGSGAEAINHSCDPNLYATVSGSRIWFVSRRAIGPGEELTLDYRLDGPDEVPCCCGSPLCRGLVNLPKAEAGQD